VQKCQSVGSNFAGSISQQMFDYLKPDSLDRVGILSFKLAVGSEEGAQGVEEDYLPEDLEKELKIVFENADRDRSGFIESNEVEELLSSLGFNENLKEIENYFARIDQNYDNRISYPEFRHFIEDQILPQMSTFDEEEEELEELLRNNDIFRHGSISGQTLQALLERYGVKLTQHEVQVLVRTLNPEGTEVNIAHFMNSVRDPSLEKGKAKGILYKIRLRKKVQLREIQKVFKSISSCFVLAYTSAIIYRGTLSFSSPFRPTLH
jgi:Ca2+-binding EF-hand superfamily protein